ncbi:MAG: creatininase family protein [Candidatus Krumholzibacteriota bacterium]|nr:creatininase family protein [Candidatus Krumholzibacteriota bacterium]
MDAGNKKVNEPESINDIFRTIRAFDTLEVGPVRIEKRRLVAPYTVSNGKISESVDLIYRYEEDVFDPDDAASINLASMMAAQIALNYGLFCGKIILRGPFDDADRRFIIDMAKNTAREIFVIKLLNPNPFLTGKSAGLSPVKAKDYVQAAIEFPDPPFKSRDGLRFTASDRNSCAILSSGGKDSLLTYGMLNETGKSVHPVFVNESGRHWFTALNSYRYFKDNVPNTSRVWVNSDRVFAWFLRRIPFVRQDFANLRADQYPLRLWTVAVFVFGALPVALRRGLGRLCLGDEYDSTQRSSFQGITHYNGYFDQSRHFDNYFSRYYLRKGWGLSQFSILRPLSEMLIEKILVERYPDLQTHQVSCHATHVEKGRVFPCGKCEKCRRIVGMLKVIGADPARCGYTPRQQEDCLAAIAAKGVHQESGGADNLYLSLSEKGLIVLPPERRKSLVYHPEIMKMRFDPRRSVLEEIPVDMRKPLLKIMMEHADGALRLEDRKWVDYDPFASSSIGKPYPFEPELVGSPGSGRVEAPTGPRSWMWSDLTWPEMEKRLSEVDVAILPVGSIEQHGPHLPLDTDAFDADYLAQRIAEACSSPKPLVLPGISYGVSYEHTDFKGTLGISNNTLSRLIYDIGISAAKNGINKLVIVNGHGGNMPALNYAAQMITRDTKIFVCVDTGETSDVDIYRLAETSEDIHAGEIETSTSLAIRPHLVKMDKAKKNIPRFSSRYLFFSSKRNVPWYVHTKRISKDGVIGDPTKASAEKGEQMWRAMISHLVSLVEDLKSMTLDEIYQRRY